MTSTEIPPTLTDWERDAVAEYEATIVGIPECFDFIDDPDLDEIKALASPLDSWWVALDSLDCDFGPRNQAGLAARRYLCAAMTEFFSARHKVLIATATSVSIRVPQPDHFDAPGFVTTSNQFLGHYGYTDFDLDEANREQWQRETSAYQASEEAFGQRVREERTRHEPV